MKNKKEFTIKHLGDLTGRSYSPHPGLTFYFNGINEILNYIKTNYYWCDLVTFSFKGSNYKLELAYKLTTQKVIEL